jgi:hypothetical protein
VLDVRADSFGEPQSVQGQRRDQRMLGRGADPGGDQDGELVVAKFSF